MFFAGRKVYVGKGLENGPRLKATCFTQGPYVLKTILNYTMQCILLPLARRDQEAD